MSTNLIYFGTPSFSAEILESVIKIDQLNVVGVVTQPDQPTGRHQTLTPSPVAETAQKYNLPTFKPNHLDSTNLSHIRLLQPDIFLVVSYGKIIPQEWLDTPKIGTFNIHFSLLPKYRGALCISEALKNGDKTAGVTLMKMDSLLDHGPIIKQTEIPVDIDDNNETLNNKLTHEAIKILEENLPKIITNKFSLTPQNETLATYTPKTNSRTHQTAFISFDILQQAIKGNGSLALHNLVRSLNPEPGAWTTINQQPLKIISTSIINNQLQINTIQLDGKNPISWNQYLNGHPLTN